MIKQNDSQDHPLRFLSDSKTIGQFYNSIDKTYHLAEYIPYERPPSKYLCGDVGNFSPSRSESKTRQVCAECFTLMSLRN